MQVLAVSRQFLYIKTVQNHIIDALIKQSELGIEHQEDLTLNEVELAKSDDEESLEEEDMEEDEEQ